MAGQLQGLLPILITLLHIVLMYGDWRVKVALASSGVATATPQYGGGKGVDGTCERGRRPLCLADCHSGAD